MLSSFIIRITTPPISAAVDSANRISELEQFIQVNVLNACGKTGLAAEVKNYLLKRGFDVVEIGNYGVPLENSIVIDRVGDVNSSLKVAYAMGIKDSFVTTEIDSALYVRATIIVGKDYFTLRPFSE
jgi:hypothetical protein